MPKPRVEQYQFWLPPYESKVLLIRSTPESYVRILKRYDGAVDVKKEKAQARGDGRALLLTCPQQPSILVIWLLEGADLDEPYWIRVLAHECWHGVCRVLEEVGMQPNPATEEAYAYLHGWLVQECVKRLQRRPLRKRAGARKK